MTTASRFKESFPFYLFVAGVFLILVSPMLTSEGVFMDGLIYSVVSKNLSNGIGSFWDLHVTETFFPQFQGHPPLSFWMEGTFFYLFGDHWFIERIYSILVFISTGYLITRIWKKTTGSNEKNWLPLLFWLIVPVVGWGCCNNMIENTLSLFVALAILFFVMSLEKRKLLFLMLSGFSIFAGFLTKGPTGLFPLALPFLYWIIFRNDSTLKMISNFLILFIGAVAPLLIIFFTIPSANLSLVKYFDIQVINSLQHVVRVESRLYILNQLLMESIPMLVMFVLIILWGWKSRSLIVRSSEEKKYALFFLATGLCGILPIMISMKQSGYYMIPAMPAIAMSFTLFLRPVVIQQYHQLQTKTIILKRFKLFCAFLFSAGLFATLYFDTFKGRDRDRVSDIRIISSRIPDHSRVGIDPLLNGDMCLHCYMARYKTISLDPEPDKVHEFYLTKKNNTPVSKEYKEIALDLREFSLFKRSPTP
jgi:4-amino-4-deoxy-L-arabinose transferase-like glycosyltransferase